MTDIEYPFWVWAVFFAVVFTALFVDIGIVNRKSEVPTRRKTIGWSIVWVSLALAFNAFAKFLLGYKVTAAPVYGEVVKELNITNAASKSE